MTVVVLAAVLVAVVGADAVVVRALLAALDAVRAENKRLVAIITAPTPNAAHAAALDRPARIVREDDRPVPPVGA